MQRLLRRDGAVREGRGLEEEANESKKRGMNEDWRKEEKDRNRKGGVTGSRLA